MSGPANLPSFSFFALASAGSSPFSGSLTSSSARSSSLAAAFDFFLSDFGFDDFPESLALFSLVPGAFGVVSFNLVAVLGVFAGLWSDELVLEKAIFGDRTDLFIVSIALNTLLALL